MVIEALYPDICNLYGDRGNLLFLKENLTDSTIIETKLNEKPYFVDHDVDMIYMGSTSESKQEMIVERLSKYKDRINELINKDVLFLLTGNALEIFGKEVKENGKIVLTGLSLLDVCATRELMNRKNSLFLGKYGDITIEGFQSQFDCYKSNMEPLFTISYGLKSFGEVSAEGIKYKNVYASTILGPILIINPDFSKEILHLDSLKFEENLYEAYKERLLDFERVIKKKKG